MQKAKRIFEKNPEAKELHVTSDGQHFFDANHAKYHAGSKTDKTVKVITRAEAEAWTAPEPEAKPEAKPKADKPAKGKANAQKADETAKGEGEGKLELE